MSVFGGKADMTMCGNPLLRSLLGAKRTCRFALHMSAYDPSALPKMSCPRFPKAVTVPEKAILQGVVDYGMAQPDPAFGAAGLSVGLQRQGRAADRAS